MLPSRPNFPFSCPTPFVSVCAYTQPGLEPIGASYADGQHWDETTYHLPIQTTNITATLYYQTSSKEYIDFLRESGGLDGQVLGEMWMTQKAHPKSWQLSQSPPSLVMGFTCR